MSAPIRVCHVAMGDLWAGAEVQLLAFMKYAVRVPGFEWSVILFNEGRLADELRTLALNLLVIPERSYGPVGLARQLAKAFRSISPDIAHTHKYKDSILGALIARYTRVPHVVRVMHGMPEPFKGLQSLKMAAYVLLDRMITRCCIDRIVAVSSDIEQALRRMYAADRVVRIHNGIDLEVVQVSSSRSVMRRTWNLSDDAVVIGTVGRLVPVKGHRVLLKAMQIVHQSHPHAKLLLVGDGPLRDQLMADAQKLGLDQAVIFAGHQDRPYDFMNMMDIFVLPSLHEGIPMVLLEAMALGVPVIATRVGGIPEVVHQQNNGMLVSAADSVQLAGAMRDLLEKREVSEKIGRAGSSLVKEKFHAKSMVAHTIRLYEDLQLSKGRHTHRG